MILTEQNYFSLEAERAYMSNHLWSMFMECEARAMAYLAGQYKEDFTDTFKIGKFIESMLQKRDAEFIEQNPDIFKNEVDKKTKEPRKVLKSPFLNAVKSYERARRDSLFMRVCSGEPQEIFTGEIGGLEWKCMTDFTNHEGSVICEIKTTASFEDDWKEVEGKNKKVPWYWVYDYPRQLAIQQELIRQKTGKNYFTIIAGITKQDPPDITLIEVTLPKDFALELAIIESKSLRIKEVYQGRETPISCGKCDHCRETKILKKIELARSIYG
jgi:hypothetical protein